MAGVAIPHVAYRAYIDSILVLLRFNYHDLVF